MRTTHYYPVIQTDDVEPTSVYRQHFGSVTLFVTSRYVHLQSNHNAGANLTLVANDHEPIPARAHGITSGPILNFEAEDVDAKQERALSIGLPILKSLRDEAFGPLHFITRDPSGVPNDVIQPIAPAAEFVGSYSSAATAS